MENNKSLNIRMPKYQHDNLKALAQIKGVSISDVAREILNSVPNENKQGNTINIVDITINNNYYGENSNTQNSLEEDCIQDVPFEIKG